MKKMLSGTELLRSLCMAFGPSGCEENVALMIKENIKGCYDELVPDRMGGVIALIRGNGSSEERLMLSAHMDEVGFMIREICEDGLLRFSSMMGSDTRIMAGRRVSVGNADMQVRGVIALKPVHTVERADRGKAATLDELYIDIGASSREEAEKYVKIGDYGTFESDFVEFGEGGKLIKAKALDDRLGCAVMIELMREIYTREERLPFDVYFAFTCREELGVSGARCASHKIRPHKALIFEATAVADIHGVPEVSKVAERGCGGAISIMDRSTIYDRDMVDMLLETAKAKNIPCQIKKYVSGGNDAGHIHKAAHGTKCAVISAPCGYIHTASDVIAKEDYNSIYSLALAAIERMGEDA
ncbi:MAG: M20/M25/M40 family metallo-hydrolase [Clostridia bacterium]|nr:M20/M25/M40 family metallo-hydrolase [Clostridia bacterium]